MTARKKKAESEGRSDAPAAPAPVAAPARKSGFVSIIGRTNVGKSSLLNVILGHKISIISDKPQTTRTRIMGVLTEARGQVVFFDTPGVHKPGHELNRRRVHHIHDALQGGDLLLHLIDVTQPFGQGEQFTLDLVKGSGVPAVLVINKIDLIRKGKILELIDHYRQLHDYAAIVPVSALTGDGVKELLDEVFAQLQPGDLLYDEDYLTNSPDRFMVAELVREKVLRHTRQELPFSTAVLVELWDESRLEKDNLLRIEATILVERDSQKAIIIGRQGRKLKEIGSEARHDIEIHLGQHVYLGLFVKVRENWRNDPTILQRLGLQQ